MVPRGRCAVVLTAGVFVAACGSTVPSASLTGGGTGGTSTVRGGAATQATGPSVPGGSALLTPGSQVGAAQPAGSAGDGASAGGGTAAAPADGSSVGHASTGRGITRGEVLVGYAYVPASGENAYINAFGVHGLSETGDDKKRVEAIVRYINGHGGVLGGRRLVLVEHASTAGDSSSNQQAECADWTQDHHVFVAVDATPSNGGFSDQDQLLECLRQRGVGLVTTTLVPGTDPLFGRYPDYYAPASLEAVRQGRLEVESLLRGGFFSSSGRIGVVYYDLPSTRAEFQQGIEQTLGRHGLSVADSAEIHSPDTTSEDGSAVASVQNAELRFRSDGVTHVLFADAGSGVSYFFMSFAQSQGYYGFRYAVTTASRPVFLAANLSARTLSRAQGIGWMPGWDVDAGTIPPNPAVTLCRQIMARAQQPLSSIADVGYGLGYCSVFGFLADALNRATTPTSPGLEAAVAGMRSDPASSAAALASGFGSAKHWGAAAYRPIAYDPSCRCFRYVDAAQPIRAGPS